MPPFASDIEHDKPTCRNDPSLEHDVCCLPDDESPDRAPVVCILQANYDIFECGRVYNASTACYKRPGMDYRMQAMDPAAVADCYTPCAGYEVRSV